MSNVLIVYYSRKGENYFNGTIKSVDKGNTQMAVEYIQSAVGGDVFEIDTIEPYSNNYRDCVERAKQEISSNARPKLKSYLEDISKYDTIFVCYPNWCGTMPMCMFTFLEHYNLAGKKIVPLCSNEGSGMGSSEKDLKSICKGAEFKEGLSVIGYQTRLSKDKISSWAKSSIL